MWAALVERCYGTTWEVRQLVKVLLLGGTGNIGRAIVDELLLRDHQVTVFNRDRRIDDLPATVERIKGDRQDRPEFERCVRAGSYGAVIDMIAYTPEDGQSIASALKGSDTHLIHCSTVCVLGVEVTRLPTPEAEPCRPITDYGRDKLTIEQMLRSAAATDGLRVTIMRPSATIGRIPPFRQIGFDPTFVDRMRLGKPLVVEARAEQTIWQVLDRRDAAMAFASAVGRDVCVGRTYHVVGDESYSWADYHRKAARALGCSQPELVPLPLDAILEAGDAAGMELLRTVFAYDGWYDNTLLKRDIPEFTQSFPLERAFADNVVFAMREGLLKDSQSDPWEDKLIRAFQSGSLRQVRPHPSARP